MQHRHLFEKQLDAAASPGSVFSCRTSQLDMLARIKMSRLPSTVMSGNVRLDSAQAAAERVESGSLPASSSR